ncbi:unnamed protein product [Clonostachys rhizophaga]|uniref:Uncharacterized protein n=1 Tax=Clonostachys rhizophaga TaxID=160324 RepID=A0A9N9VAL6_9HYPO|nr:unnamed protein product [Clonostachys rhizophaga]
MSNPALSLAHGPNESALFDLTIGQLANQQASRYGDKDCIIIGWNNTRLSYWELSESSKVLSRGLLALGVQSGDHLAISSGDDERFVQLFFAAARIGACLVIINKTYTVPECLRALKHTDPVILFVSNVVDRRPTAPISNSKLNKRQAQVDKHSTVNIQFTSGTTGPQKCQCLLTCKSEATYSVKQKANLTVYISNNISTNGFYMGHYLQLVPEDVMCCGPPRRRSSRGFYSRLLDHLLCARFRRISSGENGSYRTLYCLAWCPNQAQIFLSGIRSVVGMTETAPTSFIVRVEDSLERKLETVGTALPHASAKISHAERGVRFAVWMHTGDEGVINEHGYLTITGRIKDIIIRGGENIYPVEIEERLLHHPAIDQASIVGLQDPRYGESVNAFLELCPNQTKPTLEQLKFWVRETLGRHKAPVRVFWVGNGESITQYLVTRSGKIRKEILREAGNKMISTSAAPVSKL